MSRLTSQYCTCTLQLVNDNSVLYYSLPLSLSATDSLPPDEVYERRVNLSTKIYQYTQDGSGETPGKYTIIHEDVPTMPKIALLDSKKVLKELVGDPIKFVGFSYKKFVTNVTPQ